MFVLQTLEDAAAVPLSDAAAPTAAAPDAAMPTAAAPDAAMPNAAALAAPAPATSPLTGASAGDSDPVESGPAVGVILGSVAGAVVVLLAIAAGFLFFTRRQRRALPTRRADAAAGTGFGKLMVRNRSCPLV